MSAILVLCPSHRDHRELPLVYPEHEHRFFFHDYATAELERIVSTSPSLSQVGDPHDEIDAIVAAHADTRLDGVISTDDYPGSALASSVARRMNLPPGVRLVVASDFNLKCRGESEIKVS